jgi:hypothetical protein
MRSSSEEAGQRLPRTKERRRLSASRVTTGGHSRGGQRLVLPVPCASGEEGGPSPRLSSSWCWHWPAGRGTCPAPGTPLGQPAPAPAGEGGFVFSATKDDGSGRPVTFDPCKPIHYVVRPDGAPPSGQAMVAAAIAEVSRATGLVFIGDGDTGEAPSRNRHSREQWPFGDEAAPVLIAWSTAAESPDLAGDVAGFAGPVQVTPSGPGTARYVSGQVVLDAEDLAHAPGDALGQEAVRLVLLHELAHLVGLAHVADPAQMMFPEATPVTGYAPGDLRGLHELGLGDCF